MLDAAIAYCLVGYVGFFAVVCACRSDQTLKGAIWEFLLITFWPITILAFLFFWYLIFVPSFSHIGRPADSR